MPWKEITKMSQKEEFISRVIAGKESFSTLCTEFNISRKTGYKIWNRYQAEGIEGLQSHSRAPLSIPNKTHQKIIDKIISVRCEHKTWGARKIRSYLLKKKIKNLPAPSTITDILKRNGYVCEEESLKRQELVRFERASSNELWQMDFKGHFQLGIKETCYPLTILDDYSRFSICLHACKNEDILTVKKQLIHTFQKYGMPFQINVDNGTPWGNSSLVKHTKLTVWLLQLGVIVTHSRPRHPQTNGKNERFHRTLKEDVLKNQKIENFSHAQKIFDQWRSIYNYERPHEAIGMKVPADRYQPSMRRMPEQIPSIEYDNSAIIRKTNDKGIISYQGSEYHVGKAFSGHYLEIRPNELVGLLEVYFGKHRVYKCDIG
jgi:transposase InsO family protein